MMSAAKAASEKIREISRKLREISKKIPGKNISEKKEQDHMIRWAEALDNMAIQLRILVSVKASTQATDNNNNNNNTESSLVAITTKLGEVVKSSLTSAVPWL